MNWLALDASTGFQMLRYLVSNLFTRYLFKSYIYQRSDLFTRIIFTRDYILAVAGSLYILRYIYTSSRSSGGQVAHIIAGAATGKRVAP